jgi:hypothetical protein
LSKNVEKKAGENGVQEKQDGKVVTETEQTLPNGQNDGEEAAVTNGVEHDHVKINGYQEADRTTANGSEAPHGATD